MKMDERTLALLLCFFLFNVVIEYSSAEEHENKVDASKGKKVRHNLYKRHYGVSDKGVFVDYYDHSPLVDVPPISPVRKFSLKFI